MFEASGTSRRQFRPVFIATGFTSAFLGDERTLREFIVGDHVRERIAARGRVAVLLLINDSYDPLGERQLRIGVRKDPALIEKFLPFCGRPIAEIPDPFECHHSYAAHFAHALERRLSQLGIHPTILDTYDAYRRGRYRTFVRTVLSRYREVQQDLELRAADQSMPQLFRPQCSRCHRVDTTHVTRASESQVSYRCEGCNRGETVPIDEVQGKLSWKLDCAARWNLYGINIEVFSKHHIGELATLSVARRASERYLGGVIPRVISYGDVALARELSYRLLEVLPPAVLRSLLVENRRRDLHLTRDYVERFCRTHATVEGRAFADYARMDVALDSIQAASGGSPWPGKDGAEVLDERVSALPHAMAYAREFYLRDHALRLPDPACLAGEEPDVLRAALAIFRLARRVRGLEGASRQEQAHRLRSEMAALTLPPRTLHLIRQALRQENGPRIPSLLLALPTEYLDLVAELFELRLSVPAGADRNERPMPIGHKEAQS